MELNLSNKYTKADSWKKIRILGNTLAVSIFVQDWAKHGS